MATLVGKVGIVMKGDWSSSATYETLDAVGYNGGTYIAKQNVPANTAPTNTTYWQAALVNTNQALDISNLKLEYDSAGSTAPTASVNANTSIVRSGNVVVFSITFAITAVGSGNILKLTGLPIAAAMNRTLATAEGTALGAVVGALIRKDEQDILFHDASGSNLNSSGLNTGNLVVGGTFLV